MAQYQPDLSDLLHTVRAFLEDVGPRLGEGDRYQALVAAFLVGVAERELASAEGADREFEARLAGFLGVPGDVASLTGSLCEAIRSGKLDGRWDEAVALVLGDVVEKVKIVRPDHLAVRLDRP
jgi:hypothetical protein